MYLTGLGSWPMRWTFPGRFPSFLSRFLRFAGGDHAQNTGISSVLCPCPKHLDLRRFRIFVQHTAQGCGTRKSVTNVYLAQKNSRMFQKEELH